MDRTLVVRLLFLQSYLTLISNWPQNYFFPANHLMTWKWVHFSFSLNKLCNAYTSLKSLQLTNVFVSFVDVSSLFKVTRPEIQPEKCYLNMLLCIWSL